MSALLEPPPLLEPAEEIELPTTQASPAISYQLVAEAVSGHIMATLTGNTFVVSMALLLGAKPWVIGMLSAISPLAQLLQIPAIWLVEKTRDRRRICLLFSGLCRGAWLAIALIPLFFSESAWGLPFLFLAITFNACLGAVSTCSWNSWIRDLVPDNQDLAQIISKRLSYSSLVSIIFCIATAWFMRWYESSVFSNHMLTAYSFIFGVGFLIGEYGVYHMFCLPHQNVESNLRHMPLKTMLRMPFRDANFKNLIIFLGSWNFATHLAVPFFTVYMLDSIGLSMAQVIVLLVLNQFASALFVRWWRQGVDRYNNKSVLALCAFIFTLCMLGWTFTTMPQVHFLTMPMLVVLHILQGVATAGISLASSNLSYKLANYGCATSYLAATSIVNSLTGGLGPVLGGFTASYFARRELSMNINWHSPGEFVSIQTLNFREWDFFFFFAFVWGLYSLHRLSLVQEQGHVQKRKMLSEMVNAARNEVKNVRHLPFSMWRFLEGRAEVLNPRSFYRNSKKNINNGQSVEDKLE